MTMKTAAILGAVSVLALATAATAQDAELLVLDYPGFENPDFHADYILSLIHISEPTRPY